jgi:hypothetical protein
MEDVVEAEKHKIRDLKNYFIKLKGHGDPGVDSFTVYDYANGLHRNLLDDLTVKYV